MTEKNIEWHERRRQGIGGSDAAAACGMSPYKTAYELWLEKTGQVQPEVVNNAVYWGTALEPTLVEEFEKRTGLTVERDNRYFIHPEMPFVRAEVDGMVNENGINKIVEIKTSGRGNDWGPDGGRVEDNCPLIYHLQTQHQCLATGAVGGYLAVLIGGQDFRIYTFNRDEELIDLMAEKERRFWKMVEENVPPDIDYDHQTTASLIKKIYPGTNGETIDLPDEAYHYHKVIEDCSAKIKEMEAVKAGAMNRIANWMGEAAVGKLPDGTAYTRKVVKRKGFSVEPSEYVNMRFCKKLK